MEDIKINDDLDLTASIIDAEGDEINCSFNYDNCVEIDANNLSYITLTIDNLNELINLIEKTEEIYNKIYKLKGGSNE